MHDTAVCTVALSIVDHLIISIVAQVLQHCALLEITRGGLGKQFKRPFRQIDDTQTAGFSRLRDPIIKSCFMAEMKVTTRIKSTIVVITVEIVGAIAGGDSVNRTCRFCKPFHIYFLLFFSCGFRSVRCRLFLA
ncbi:MAG: hypothetical protein GX173_08520 [Ruminococcaceae bacterium]|nr:hypothetical protein [Oscillospiraceae bacterium]